MMTMREHLTQYVDAWEKLKHPSILERFVLRNGHEHIAQSWDGEPGEQKQCFQNATHLHIGDYVEGFVFRRNLPIHFLHAWRVKDGRVLDPTLREPEECLYMGVTFTSQEVWRELNKNRVYGILDPGIINLQFIFDKDPELKTISEQILERKINLRSKTTLPKRTANTR